MPATHGEIAVESVTDPHTGTRRLDLWAASAEGGGYGDDARGTAYSARYLSEDEHGCAEVAVYENDLWRPADSATINYEWADVRVHETLESAQEAVDRIGVVDQSWCLSIAGPDYRPHDDSRGTMPMFRASR